MIRKMMNDAEKKFFNDNGYLLLKHVFSEEECAKFKASLFEEIEKGKEALRLEGAGGNAKPTNRGKIADVPRGIHKGMLQDIAHRNEMFMELARDERVTACVSPFLGEDLVMYRSLSVFKPKDYQGPVGWHQDMTYWEGEDSKITVWISLDNVTDENGALHVIPGTHKFLVDEYEEQNEIFPYVIPEKLIEHDKEVIVDAEVGDVVIFHSQTFHSSKANQSGGDRYVLIYTLQPASDQSHHRDGPPVPTSGKKVAQTHVSTN